VSADFFVVVVVTLFLHWSPHSSAPFSLEIGEFSVKIRKKLSGFHRPFPQYGEVDVEFDENLDGEEQYDEGMSRRVGVHL
jgi:hypothetical protein